jgi:hypothetical protein
MYLATNMIPHTSMEKPADDFRRCMANIWSPYDVNGEVKKNKNVKTSTNWCNHAITNAESSKSKVAVLS